MSDDLDSTVREVVGRKMRAMLTFHNMTVPHIFVKARKSD